MTMNVMIDSLFDLPQEATVVVPSSPSTQTFSLPKLVSRLAYHAMMLEVHLTPKPGLVDALNNGSHDDMTLATFVVSANAIVPYFAQFVDTGTAHAHLPVTALLSGLRPIGVEAEQAMFSATHGVNTHKGMIFNLGLICGAVGWLQGNHLQVDELHIKEVIRQSCQFLVYDELKRCTQHAAATAGEQMYQQYGLTGARGEAASGLTTVMNYALPAYRECLIEGVATEQALWHTLLVIMANNDDSNLVHRGGIEGLRFVQDRASYLLKLGGYRYPNLESELMAFDRDLIAKHLSPGGSADLLAAAWLVHELVQLFENESFG
ncbi:triphosphoribosyl-dephospho-CoA synthase CitG [Celerinatantimonas diazotrophica]|uniref:Probable 2-(5''-triphosphoribosyl)-3'-dephosphocoenzyme-A synthase n=1 Tax=Celerinatantimonas diazotrophica TaxID=412034 RepID=A0A4R1K4W5_9GAMM|nr:triphosphoribosyl-dephospho-CoA synthase CitG [Celerinatantimonas diazotrophica]TCK58783.1 triphosphoribosyl-dephospho-CoA synthase [Celerinatantimonas diazotrophica]CAG9297415.1 2-(5''-triphosphoribosyl)-3'-dephosphocoenzyme-A synthase [Celerinatantimonas diazotrophica]